MQQSPERNRDDDGGLCNRGFSTQDISACRLQRYQGHSELWVSFNPFWDSVIMQSMMFGLGTDWFIIDQ